MDTDPIETLPDNCPHCHSTDTYLLERLVSELHVGTDRRLKGGASHEGYLRATCLDCDTTFWETTPVELIEDTLPDDWTTGDPCPHCGRQEVIETHVDEEHRHFGTNDASDGDRLTTIQHRCSNCRLLLATAPYDNLVTTA